MQNCNISLKVLWDNTDLLKESGPWNSDDSC